MPMFNHWALKIKNKSNFKSAAAAVVFVEH